MAAKNNFRFEGLADIDKILDALPKKLGPKVIANVLRSGAKPMIDRGRELAPKDDGDLKASIGVVAGRGAGKGQSIYVGPRRGGKFNGYAGHLIEYGTAGRVRKDGKSTGSMPAKPFWRPAFDQTIDEVLERIKKNLALILSSDFRNVDFNTGKILPEAAELPGSFGGVGGAGRKQKPPRGAIQTGRKGGRYYITANGKKVYIKR